MYQYKQLQYKFKKNNTSIPKVLPPNPVTIVKELTDFNRSKEEQVLGNSLGVSGADDG